ncbi:MAG TPA: proline dehydrogenase family protein [Candidatus Acidoferrales bacterium]
MLIRKFIFWLSSKKRVTGALARRGMKYGFAQRFVTGETIDDALAAVAQLNRAGIRASLNHLGENVATPSEAERARDSYLEMIQRITAARLDCDISVKLTQLGLDFDRELCGRLLQEIIAAVERAGSTLEIDMEGSAYTEPTLGLFEQVARSQVPVTLAVQAYLRRSEADVRRLSRSAGRPRLRLVKGAYLEPAAVAFRRKSEVDSNYRRLLDLILTDSFFPIVATHDERMVRYAEELLSKRGFTPEEYEFQMVYGIRRDLQRYLVERRHPLRIYVPFGTEWCPYFMRRLAERPANALFVVRSLLREGLRPRG